LRIQVYDTAATCAACGGEEFNQVVEGDRGMQAVFVCAKCNTPTSRFELLMGIADRAVKDFEAFRDTAHTGGRDKPPPASKH
jgi:transcription elongation factor Elf1